MAIQRQKIEDKSIKSGDNDSKEVEFNYPGQVTIKAKSKDEADKKYKELNKK